MRSLAALLLFAASASAADDGWVTLTDDAFDHFRTKPREWLYADKVELKSGNPQRFDIAPGKGILVNGEKGRANDLYTKEAYGDMEVKLEVNLPKGSNSGIKFHGVYEIQLCDSFGKKTVTGSDCGGIYPRAELKPTYHHIDNGIAPKVNACKAPGEWQTLEVSFRAPRFDKDGKKTENARIAKAVLNGQVIHEDQEMLTPTGNNYTVKEVASAPFMLQGDHGPVAFRNLRVRAGMPTQEK